MSGKELAKLLAANGWDLLRIQGSHHIYGKVGNPARISVWDLFDRMNKARTRIVEYVGGNMSKELDLPSSRSC